jgi:hypothetical protein
MENEETMYEDVGESSFDSCSAVQLCLPRHTELWRLVQHKSQKCLDIHVCFPMHVFFQLLLQLIEAKKEEMTWLAKVNNSTCNQETYCIQGHLSIE